MPQAINDAVWPRVWEAHEPFIQSAMEHKDLEVAWRHLSHAAGALLSHADGELGQFVVVECELRDGYGDRAGEPRIVHTVFAWEKKLAPSTVPTTSMNTPVHPQKICDANSSVVSIGDGGDSSIQCAIQAISILIG